MRTRILACRCCAKERDRRVRASRAREVQAVHRPADRAGADLRRSGRDRDRECRACSTRCRRAPASSPPSLDDLRTAQDRLIQSEKLASLGQLTAGIAHEIKNPLNFVNNFSALSGELIDELQRVLKQARARRDKLAAEVDELTQHAEGNLEKVVQHGKRADSIVKNMLLHSREGSGEHRPVDINAMVEESLNLAYHGARAEKPGFNVTLAQVASTRTPATVDLYPQEITRVLLNLISNGFYADDASARQSAGERLTSRRSRASTRDLGDSVEIAHPRQRHRHLRRR